MYMRNFFKKPMLLLIFGAILLTLIVACGGGDPEELDIPVKVENGSLTPATIQVKQGDMVTLKIDTEEAGEFHLHGYDIEMDVPAGVPTDFFVLADITGRFKITFHAAGEDHDEGNQHGAIFESDSLEPGATFTYTVGDGQEVGHIPFHSNLHPEINGLISVSENSDAPGEVSIEYVDTEAIPQEISVAVGTIITWVNNSSETQNVVSGFHMKAAEEHEGEEMEGMEEEEEIQIGILEVSPR